MGTTSRRIAVGGGALILACAAGGCGKVEQKPPADPGKPRAEATRHRAACASSVAYDRLKTLMFDQAVSRHAGDRANLDILADYSVVRIEEPVVDGWDPALDRTRCTGRFILQMPPGAERAFDGQRRLEADIAYTAQAAADGSGLVYRLSGAEPIVARLAAFTLSAGAYRPSPAIDQERDDAATVREAALPPVSSAPVEPTAVREERPTRPDRRPIDIAGHDEGVRDAERRGQPERIATGDTGDTGEAAVRSFYGALGDGDGRTASARMIPEKRTSRAFSPDALTRFYGQLAEPIRLTRIVPLATGAYRVSYRYSAGRSRCRGRAVVRLANRNGHDLIRSIDALDGC